MIWFRDVSLDSVADVHAVQVSVSAPQVLPLCRQRPLGYGAAYGGLRYGARTVDITFALLETNAQYRQQAIMQVCAWAAGSAVGPLALAGWEGVHLMAVCTAFPMAQATWEHELRLTFTAFDPLWRSDFEQSALLESDAFVGGMIEPEMRLTVDNDARQDIAWTQDGCTLRLLNIPAGHVAVDLNRQLITLDGQSAMRYMDVTSAFPRPVTGRLNITGPGRAHWRERWL